MQDTFFEMAYPLFVVRSKKNELICVAEGEMKCTMLFGSIELAELYIEAESTDEENEFVPHRLHSPLHLWRFLKSIDNQLDHVLLITSGTPADDEFIPLSELIKSVAPPMISEVYNERRMRKCGAIQQKVMENWRKSNRFEFVVRATEPILGKSIDELRQMYFSVGVRDDVTDVPFIDVLTIFTMIVQLVSQIKEKRGQRLFTATLKIKTAFTHDEAFAILKQLQVSTLDQPVTAAASKRQNHPRLP